MNTFEEGYEGLRLAVVKQAAADYKNALSILKRHPKDMNALRTKEECERFFREDIGAYCELDGEMLISGIRGKVYK